MTKLKISVQAKSENDTKTIVKARDFKMIIDEAEEFGGTNAGANPVEYVLAALSGCLNVVGHLVAKEMGFTLRGIEIYVEGYLDPAKFMGESTQARAGCLSISAIIKPDTDAERVTLDKWLKTVESRCPISDNISNSTPVEIVLG